MFNEVVFVVPDICARYYLVLFYMFEMLSQLEQLHLSTHIHLNVLHHKLSSALMQVDAIKLTYVS